MKKKMNVALLLFIRKRRCTANCCKSQSNRSSAVNILYRAGKTVAKIVTFFFVYFIFAIASDDMQPQHCALFIQSLEKAFGSVNIGSDVLTSFRATHTIFHLDFYKIARSYRERMHARLHPQLHSRTSVTNSHIKAAYKI